MIFGNDPTPIIIADVAVTKQAVDNPVKLSNGNFEVTYELLIENNGTVDLSNLTLIEDLATQYGPVYVNAHTLLMVVPPSDASSSITLEPAWNGGGLIEMMDLLVPTSLAVGDSFLLNFVVEVDAVAATGALTNQVTVGGTAVDEDGNPYTDSNGDPITTTDDSDSGSEPSDINSGEPGDNGGSDDPTPLYVADVGLAKEAGTPVANGDNWDVPFTLVFENTGTVDLTNLTMMDDIMAEFGNAFVSAQDLSVQNFTGSGTPPTANVGWETDTTQSMISGGTAVVDDTFEVTFTVTIDPDGIDNVSQGLLNQATTAGDGLDENGDPLTDPNGNPVTATDDSDNGSDPTGENGDDGSDSTFGNDPTPILIADISAAKQVFGTPVALPDGTYEVTYEVVIENIGTVDLADLTVTEDLMSHFGAPFISAGSLTMITAPMDASSTLTLDTSWDGASTTEFVDQSAASLLAIGDSFVVQFNVNVDPDAGGTSGPLLNQIVSGGTALDDNGDPITDPNGDPVTATDDSDSGTDTNSSNAGDPGDEGTSNDPTPLLIPDVGIAKLAGDPVANGDNWDVVFTLFMENTGTADLNNLTMIDDVMSEFGNAFVSASDLTIGSLSGTGSLPSANTNWVNDTSMTMLTGGALDVGSSFDLSFVITIDPDGVDSISEGLVNQATGTGDGLYPDGSPMTDSNGNPVTVSDDSDNGIDSNSDDDNPTPILIADLSIAKAVLGDAERLDSGNFSVTYQLVVENTGTVDLVNLSLIEDLGTQFGPGFVNAGDLIMTEGPTGAASAIVPNAAFDGSGTSELMDSSSAGFLEIGDSFKLEFIVEIDVGALPASAATNSVSGSADGMDSNGDPIMDANGNPLTTNDDSDSGSDPSSTNPGEPGDTSGSDDPTPVPFFEPLIGSALPEPSVLNLSDIGLQTIGAVQSERPFLRPFAEVKLGILSMLESLKSLGSAELQSIDDVFDPANAKDLHHDYVNQEGSQGFSSGKGYRGTLSVDPTDDCGRFFIDTIVNDALVAVMARSTIDPARSVGVSGFTATLANGEELPDWISEMANGELLIDRSVGIEAVALKLVAHRDGAEDLVRFVEIDTLTGQIRNQQQTGTFGAGFYTVLAESANDDESAAELGRAAE